MDEDSRPETSPYAVPSVAMNFGGRCKLYISPHLLIQSHKLQALYLDNALLLLDVSHDAAHVLVHYLITGTYQCLKFKCSSPQQEVSAEFSTSVRVYTAAKTYALPDLAELAKAEIEKLGKMLRFPLASDLLRDAYSDPKSDDMWVISYLKNRLKAFLMDGLMEPAVRELAASHKAVSISDILFETMLELFREKRDSPQEKAHVTIEKVAVDVDSINTPEEKENNKEAAGEGQGQTDREAEQTINEAVEETAQETTSIADAPLIAKEEAEIAQLIDKRDNSFLGLNRSGEQRLHLLQKRAKERAEVEAALQADAAAKEAQRATKEDKVKNKKGKKSKKNNNNNVVLGIRLLGQPEDHTVVKPKQETIYGDENEIKDDSGALNDQKSVQGQKPKYSEMKAAVVRSSKSNPAAESDDSKELLKEDEGWQFWGFGKKNEALENEESVVSNPPSVSALQH
ncbi:hypothetical protein V8C35DRAFT_283398 [Trichoderma chlorosporum]